MAISVGTLESFAQPTEKLLMVYQQGLVSPKPRYRTRTWCWKRVARSGERREHVSTSEAKSFEAGTQRMDFQ